MRRFTLTAVLLGLSMFTAVPKGLEQPAAVPPLVAEIRRTIREPESPARTARLARLSDQVDRLPDTQLDTKIQGHLALEIVDDIAARHATWLIDGARTWDAALRKKYAGRLVDCYIELAEILAADGRNDEALSLMRRAPAEVPEAPS